MTHFVFRPVTNKGNAVRIERGLVDGVDTVTVTYERDATAARVIRALNKYPGLSDFRVTLQSATRELADPMLAIPPGLSEQAQQGVEAILDLAEAERSVHTGGCRAFYSPTQWAARGETFGQGAELVVVHDGSELARYFSYDREDYDAIERMSDRLEPLGLYAESLTAWATGLYAVKKGKVSR